jgi:glycerophosphoryl diester phosphodiesterase
MKVVAGITRSLHSGVRLAALLVIAACLGLLVIFLFFASLGEEYTSGRIPTQFYDGLARDGLLDDYERVFGVAHNSGDRIETTKEALAHGADVIEIDVVSLDGTLYAAHSSPLRYIGPRVFRGPALAEVWEAAAEADVIKLDLKESSNRYLDLLIAFLEERGDREVVVASGNERALRTFQDRYPRAIRLLSVGNSRDLRRLRERPARVALVDGVTIRASLVDEDAAAWLREQGMLIFVWTVNDLDRLNTLVLLGVDAVTTDNLAIMELLGGSRRREVTLDGRIRR